MVVEFLKRIHVSAMKELKEFSGKDRGEDQARSWISKVKSAFLRDQGKGCLDRQYYIARKRSDETPPENLHRLNVAAKHTKIAIKEERLATSTTRREHVKHFIATLGDRELEKQLTLLRLADVDEVEETLRACQRMETRQMKTSMGSNKFRQRTTTSSIPMSSKTARAKRSRLCIYAFVERQRKNQEINDRIDSIANIHNDSTLALSSVKRVNDYARSLVRMEIDLAPGESRGYWKYHTTGKWLNKQKRRARSTMKKPLCCSTLALKCRSSILPLLLRWNTMSTRRDANWFVRTEAALSINHTGDQPE
uniref:Uncharacterized protein n=1 Tax=Hyaloperonospora arabidopsidis (strain Emoy2) TaxID=559515 RepID=M4B7T3_HYAAE